MVLQNAQLALLMGSSPHVYLLALYIENQRNGADFTKQLLLQLDLPSITSGLVRD